MGGVAELLVPDNRKSAVTRPCRYEPQANATDADRAAPYRTAILPARGRRPRDKAKSLPPRRRGSNSAFYWSSDGSLPVYASRSFSP